MLQQSQRLQREPNSHEGGIAASSTPCAAILTAGKHVHVVNASTSYSAPSLWLSLQQNDQEPPCQTHGPFFVGSMGLESVPRAAVVSLGASTSPCRGGLNTWLSAVGSAEREASTVGHEE